MTAFIHTEHLYPLSISVVGRLASIPHAAGPYQDSAMNILNLYHLVENITDSLSSIEKASN